MELLWPRCLQAEVSQVGAKAQILFKLIDKVKLMPLASLYMIISMVTIFSVFVNSSLGLLKPQNCSEV